MKVRRYQDADFDQVRSWLEARSMKVIHPKILAPTGFIIDGVAYVSLYKTDGEYCLVEELISNPEIESSVRDRAIVCLIDEAFKEAKNLGFKFVQSVTDHPSVIKRAVLLGAAIEVNKVLITKQLT